MSESDYGWIDHCHFSETGFAFWDRNEFGTAYCTCRTATYDDIARALYLSNTRRDETCILRKKRDTVICGQYIVEQYLREGYVFDWEATDKARLSTKEGTGE